MSLVEITIFRDSGLRIMYIKVNIWKWAGGSRWGEEGRGVKTVKRFKGHSIPYFPQHCFLVLFVGKYASHKTLRQSSVIIVIVLNA
jgi:hypothetical protein